MDRGREKVTLPRERVMIMFKEQKIPQKILIVNPFGIGDVLLTIPLINQLKRYFPDAFIGYLANKRTACIVENNPKINKVFVYERDDFLVIYQQSKWQFFQKWVDLTMNIKSCRFDLAIDLSMNASINFMLWRTGIKERIGFNYKNRSPFLTKKIPFHNGYEGKHVADYYLSVLKEIGLTPMKSPLELTIPLEDQQWADKLLEEHGLDPQVGPIGLIPAGGASWGKDALYKRWAPKKFAQLADKIIEKFNAKVILLGNQNEQGVCSLVHQMTQNRCRNLCGRTTILQLAALLKRCRLCVVNDGGPLHVAVAVGTPTVSIFGPVDEKVYGPYLDNGHRVVTKDIACRPCYRNFRRAQCEHLSCLNLIEVEDVLREVEEGLQNTGYRTQGTRHGTQDTRQEQLTPDT